VIDKQTGAIGDNDPIDVLELGSRIHPTGSVIGVQVLGKLIQKVSNGLLFRDVYLKSICI
jgi:inorganic pyrophosphatase